MLPGMSGYEICTRLKIRRPQIAIIMITARGAEMDKISGPDVGADDYMTKPFSMQELMARIRAVFRRYNLGTSIPDQVSLCMNSGKNWKKILHSPNKSLR